MKLNCDRAHGADAGSSAPLAQQGAATTEARIEALKTSVTNGVEARRQAREV